MSGDLEQVQLQLPTLSETLTQWLSTNGVSTQRGNKNAQLITHLEAQKSADLWRLVDYFAQVKMAARVMQGYIIAYIQTRSERDFLDGLEARGWTRTLAYQLIDVYHLFVELPRLDLLDKAAALGASRIRELKVQLGIDGLCRLIGDVPTQGLTYDAALGMSHRDILAWRKQQYEKRLAQDTRGDPTPYVAPPAEPHALTVARDEVLAAVHRAQLEITRATELVDQLLRPAHDDWQPAREELARETHVVLCATSEQAAALDATLQQRFGGGTVALDHGAYHTLAVSTLQASRDAAQSAADAELEPRASRRQSAWKQRGAPPKTLDSVIAQALRLDGIDG